ncbi:PLP-dependent aminotransferase family protein [Paenibacillus sp. GCM10027626]|uniref:MocR-like pyridoxine biosynthesis transcription factor PdxR n=1 Tax=Paenibacillus sp. GCM10027626 TaxID=3273411 RepID=UPI0036339ECA
MIEITFRLDDASGEPLYLQIYQYIKHEIIAGRLSAGTRLPAIRTLADSLGTSRTPAALAYEQLLAEGYVRSKPRSGLYVAVLDPLPQQAVEPDIAGGGQTLPRAYHALPGSGNYDFGYGAVDLGHFPLSKWKALLSRCFLPENSHVLLYGDYQGELELRQEIAAYVRQIRGVRCTAEQIVIGAGTYHSLDLLLQLLDGDVAAIAAEDSVNDGVKALLERSGLPIRPLRLEEDGINIADVYASDAQAVYVTPSHQFPFGMTLSIGKRIKLLEWASSSGGFVIENDYDGEYRYGGRPIPALQGLDENGRVVYVGTFSKSLIPSLRLSYMILPPSLLSRFRARQHSYDQLASPIFQKTLQLFMQSGDFERHIRKMRKVYSLKRDHLIAAIRSKLGQAVTIIGSGSGLHILLQPNNGCTEQQLVQLAKEKGVHVYPTSIYSLGPSLASPATVLLGFGGLSEQEITAGIERLAQAWL